MRRKCFSMRFVMFILIAVFSSTVTVWGATYQLTGIGEYIMEDNETLKDAQEMAFKEAMRSMAEQAASYVRANSRVENKILTDDEVELLAAALIKVREKRFEKEVMHDGKLKVRALLQGNLDEERTDKVLTEKIKELKEKHKYDEMNHKRQQAKKKKEAAQQEYEKALQHNVPALMDRGNKLCKQGKYPEALLCYNDVIAQKPQYARGYIGRGVVFLKMGKIEEADRDLSYGITLGEDGVEGYFYRGDICDRQGKKDVAIKAYRTFIDKANIVEYGEQIMEALARLAKLEVGK